MDGDLELLSGCGSAEKVSAMVAWEARPTIIEGVVDLPVIDEESISFHSVEGWAVRDALAAERRQHEIQRAQSLRISELKGVGSRGRPGFSLPPRQPCPGPKKQVESREQLAQLPCGAIPAMPQLVEESEHGHASEAVPAAPSPAAVVPSDASSCVPHRRRRHEGGAGRHGFDLDVQFVWGTATQSGG